MVVQSELDVSLLTRLAIHLEPYVRFSPIIFLPSNGVFSFATWTGLLVFEFFPTHILDFNREVDQGAYAGSPIPRAECYRPTLLNLLCWTIL